MKIADVVYCNALCRDCGHDTSDEYYMVADDVWREALSAEELEEDDREDCLVSNGILVVFSVGLVLCVGCIEQRLGRRLSAPDFTGCEANTNPYWGPRSARLLDRMRN